MTRKSTTPETAIRGDAAKYLCYREAWARIGLAREHGFPFEAVAIVESILTDRIDRYLTAASGAASGPGHESLGQLVRRWRAVHPAPVPQGPFADLRVEVDLWRAGRNRAVHGIVRSPNGAAPTRIDEFLAAAVTAAETGATLARAVSAWCDRTVRAIEKLRPAPPSDAPPPAARAA